MFQKKIVLILPGVKLLVVHVENHMAFVCPSIMDQTN